MPSTVPPLAAVLASIPDPRCAQGRRHPLSALLLLTCVAMLSGARGELAIADWAKNYGEPWRARLGFTHSKGPSQSTLYRVFARISVNTVEARLAQWAQQVVGALSVTNDDVTQQAVALDGKTLRMSARCGASDPHLLSLYSQQLGVVLGQVAVPDKTNEITASEDALALLMLRGVVVTGDAMFTQREIARSLVEAGNAYLFVVKENQPTLYQDIVTLFADPATVVDEAYATANHSHRREERRLRTSTELNGYSAWPGLAQVVCMERRATNRRTGEARMDCAYAITSLLPTQASPAQVLTLWREHWHIENKLHYVRDVTFDEDRSTVRTGTIPQLLATLRNAVIGLMRLAHVTNIAAACRRYAAQPALALAAVGLLGE